jgi:phenylacetate-CoA ligase
VLDETGRPCAPGHIGRVVITPLHSFAMPLLRYEIGDEAEPGDACPCGRGLPVLTRVVGRTQDYLVLPSGERRRFDLPHYRLARVMPVREFQVAQRSLSEVELRLVVSRTLTADEEDVVRGVLRDAFPEFACTIDYRPSLPRTRRRKLRPFVSELPD